MSRRRVGAVLAAVGLTGALAGPAAPVRADPPAPITAAAVVVDIAAACGGSSRAPFPDRPSGPAGEAVDCLARFAVTSGDAGGRYRPASPVSRAQMATFLFRVGSTAGAALSVPGLPRFPDVDRGSAHGPAIDAVAAGGITSGRADGTYGPTEALSRAQMASFLDRLVTALDPTLAASGADAFRDDAGVHEPAINRITALGLAAGVSEGRFDPQGLVSRQQMALFLARTLALAATRSGTVPAAPRELAVVVTGLPAGVPASVRVDAPGAGASLTGSGTLPGAGTYVVSAAPVPVAGGVWWPATRGGRAVAAAGAATSAEEVVVPSTGPGGSVQVRYGTFIPWTTLVLTESETARTTISGTAVVTPVPLDGVTHVVGQPVPEHPAGFTLRLDDAAGSTATGRPVPFTEAVPYGALERAPGQGGTFGAHAAPVTTREALPCGGFELRLGHVASFTLEVDPRVEWGWRPSGDVSVHIDHEATTGLQLSGGACEGFEVPITAFAGSRTYEVGPVGTKVAWGPRVYGEVALRGEATAEVTRRERSTTRLRLPVAGAAQLTTTHRVDDMRVAVVDGGLTLTGEFGLKVGLQLQGGPFATGVDVGLRAAGDVTGRPGIPAVRIDCSLRLEAFAEALGRFNGVSVAAEAVASVPVYSCPPPLSGEPVTLGPGGTLGDLSLFADEVEAVDYLRQRLGAPDRDNPDFSCDGGVGAPGRTVIWGPLRVMIEDDPRDSELGPITGPAVVGWQYLPVDGADRLGLRTLEGIGLGSDLRDLRTAYPDGYLTEDLGIPVYDVFRGDFSNLSFYLRGERVVAITSGAACPE